MKSLVEILTKVVVVSEGIPDSDILIEEIRVDSRGVKSNDLFVAISGVANEGHDFIAQAIQNGAKCIVCEHLPKLLNDDILWIKVENSREALAQMAANYYDNPTEEIQVVGITGTNGKTTVASMSYQLFRGLGYKVGLISTIENRINDEVIPSRMTTPDAMELQYLFRKMVDEACEYVFMEVSSHAIHQDRIRGILFAGGLFTNLTHDHLDYHGSFKEYLYAKKKFFDNLSKHSFAIVNYDDKNGKVMVQNCNARKISYALHHMADYKGKVLRSDLFGLELKINNYSLYSRLVGKFNAYNLLAVFAIAKELGQEDNEVLPVLSALRAPDGRFDVVLGNNKKITAIVDYAHTPDALSNVLKTIRNISKDKNVITVVGCGGNRDRTKRPIMAQEAMTWSNRVILTSDNPRNEDPDQIIQEMIVGIPSNEIANVLVVPDRKEAIKVAVSIANEGDVVLVAGKGHEKYQEIKGEKFPFDDKTILKAQLL